MNKKSKDKDKSNTVSDENANHEEEKEYSKLAKERDELKEEKRRKRISLEYLWRNAEHFLKREKENFNTQSREHIMNIKRMIQGGEAFEMIDGDNLEFKEFMIS
jgi:hypothetical protein